MNHQDQQAPANGSPRPARLWAKLHAGRAGGDKPRSSTALATLIALALAACGGGGGGSSSGSSGGSSTPSCAPGQVLSGGVCVTPVDAALTVAVTPADGASAVKRDAVVVTAVPTVTAGSFSTHTSTGLVCNGATIVAGDKAVLTGQTLTLTPTAALLPGYGDTCVAQGQAVANGKDTGKQATVTWKTTFTIEKEPAWWPPKFVPQGTKVYLDSKTAPAGATTNATFPGQTESGLLPPECRIVGDTCWHEAVRNGALNFKATTARNLLQSDRPIAWVHYKTVDTIFWPGQGKKLWCLKPVFADDGTVVKKNPPIEDECSPDEQTWSITNDLGVLYQEKNSSTGVAACYQKRWDNVRLGWETIEAKCP